MVNIAVDGNTWYTQSGVPAPGADVKIRQETKAAGCTTPHGEPCGATVVSGRPSISNRGSATADTSGPFNTKVN